MQQFWKGQYYKHINNSKILEAIRDGRKSKEGRRLSEFWNEGLIGKEIYFGLDKVPSDKTVMVHTRITGLTIYNGKNLMEALNKMLSHEGWRKMMPHAESSGDALAEYMMYNKEVNNNQPTLIIMGAFTLEILN